MAGAPPIVILTGAGISRESGLETFRDTDGVWSRVRIEEVATPEAFRRNPVRVHDFYNARRRQLADPSIQPNAAHLALARLEREWPAEVMVVTQNVDDLHERAGSRLVVHMHGELRKVRCAACRSVTPWEGDLAVGDRCGHCGRVSFLRPDVVWFGEMPLEMPRIEAALAECGLFASIGTSGTVYPAAGFIEIVRQHGRAHSIELNLEPSLGHSRFAEAMHGPASEVVPAWVDRLLADALAHTG
ncbi:MAG: NAD-dependent protein deacylase [Thalassobaculales bacterium]